MPSTLKAPAVATVLDRLHAAAQVEDEPAKQRVRDREADLGARLSQVRRYELYGEAPLAIKREVGELLYLLTLSRRARTVVEFGASLGVSTLYLAAALRDCGGGSLITTEQLAGKADATRKNLVDAGLDDLLRYVVCVKRTTIMLPDALDARLRHEARRRGASIADVARKAIDAQLPNPADGGRLSFFAIGEGGPEDASERVDHFVGRAVEDRNSDSS